MDALTTMDALWQAVGHILIFIGCPFLGYYLFAAVLYLARRRHQRVLRHRRIQAIAQNSVNHFIDHY